MKKQQGDVILKKAAIPIGAVKVIRSARGYVLAEGEATGHAHVIKEEDVEMYEKDGVFYLKIFKPVEIRHEEHNPIHLTLGTYKVDRVREYDPFEEEIRRVID